MIHGKGAGFGGVVREMREYYFFRAEGGFLKPTSSRGLGLGHVGPEMYLRDTVSN